MEALEARLVEIIEGNEDEVALKWYRDVRESNYVPTMQNVSEDEGMRIARTVYENLSKWLLDAKKVDIKETYGNFGQSLFHRGFRLEEVVQIIVLLKRYLWLHLLEMGLMTTDLNVYQTLELNNKVILYYDRSIYFALIGYGEGQKTSGERAVSA